MSVMRPLDQLRYLILAAQREGERAFARALRPAGLTPSQAEALSVLRDARRPLTVRELGDRLVCERGSPSRLAGTLVAKGLVSTESDAKDARVTRLRLSSRGKGAAVEIVAAEDRLFARLAPSLDPRAVHEACALLRGIVGELPAGKALALRIAERGATQRSSRAVASSRRQRRRA
jgi:DNA-binding MarR family transcriptional regulator